MKRNEYLNEEKYQKTVKKLQKISLLVLIVGFIIGGLLLYKGITTEKIDKNALKIQQNEEFKLNGLSKKYYELSDKIHKDDSKYVFISLGAMILIISSMTSLVLYTTSKQREINAFYAQQQMPLAQEGLEKIAPAAGKAAKEITKGVKEGLK